MEGFRLPINKTLIALLTFTFFSVPFALRAESLRDPKTLFEATCSECHSTDIPKSKRLSRAEWQDIVQRMKSNGLSISQEDERIIIEYLSTTYGNNMK